MSYSPKLLRERTRSEQILVAGLAPVIIGALAGVLIGTSAATYWVVAVLAGVGALLSGFEHRDGWGGADRGMVGGIIYGVSLLLVHALVGTHAKVSLGSFPPLLILITAIVGAVLGACGGRLARGLRQRETRLPD